MSNCIDCGQAKTGDQMATKQYCKDCLNNTPTATQILATEYVFDKKTGQVAVTF